MKYKDGAVEKKTIVNQVDDTDKISQVEKVERYTETDIDKGIANCDRLLATGLNEVNAKAVQAEKEWWLECKALIPEPEEVNEAVIVDPGDIKPVIDREEPK